MIRASLINPVIIFFAGLLSASVLADDRLDKTGETLAAYAAGYKAAFTCSATFNARKSKTQIAAQELSGIYPAYQAIVNNLPEAVVHEKQRWVSVAFSKSLPPRIAVWRPHLGCVQLPTGADPKTIAAVPDIVITPPHHDDNAPWQQRSSINGTSGNPSLDNVVKSAFKGDAFNTDYGKDAFTTAILIATPERLIAEHYIEGYDHKTSQRTWSVAKSIAASVIGVAVKDSIVDLKAPAGISSWQQTLDPRNQITLENLLHMASGLDSNRAGNRTDRLYLGGGRVVDTAASNALEVLPGSRWKYANNDTVLAMLALRHSFANQVDYLAYPFQKLLHKIGMMDTYLETDWNGDFIMSSQVWTTSRDLARLGILYLNNGIWNGEQILPGDWRTYVSSPAPAQPERGNIGYGAQFWLYRDYAEKTRIPVPTDAFAARGNRGQFLMIIPSRQLVIVRRGHDPAGGEGFQLERFTASVLKVL